MKSGYKQTDVGVIPTDWTTRTLGELSRSVTRGASPRPIDSPEWFDERSMIGWVRISDVTKSGRYLVETTQRLSDAGVRNSRFVPSGSLIMSICATVGRPIETRIDVCIHDGFVVFDRPAVDQSFLYYVLTELEPRWSSKGQTGSQMNLNTGLIKGTKIAIPSKEDEQRAIAAALSDVDALLAKLDQLIAKKRDIKQAAMQQLLTSKKRLPGFSGEWDVKPFSEVLSRVNGKAYQIQSSDYQETGDHPVVDQGKEPVIGFSDRADKVFHCPSGGVIVFGDHTCIVKFVDFDFVVGADGTQIMAGKNGQSVRFHAYQLEYLGIPTTGYNRHFKFVKEREFITPTLAEQTAIATVLSDMDAEIIALESRRDKTSALKQGMMQELLTGRIRLVSKRVLAED